MQISDTAISKCRENMSVTGKLIAAFDKHQYTIERWYENKNPLLTTPTAVEIIKRETGLTEEEILVPDNVNA